MELCPQVTETDNCFSLLPIVGGSESVRDNRICVPYANQEVDIKARVQVKIKHLTDGIVC